MKQGPGNPPNLSCRVTRRGGTGGLTLIEMIVAVGIGSIVLAIVGLLTVHALRSFAAMGNYASLDAHNRQALDKMTRDVRQATQVMSFYRDADTRWIKFATSDPAATIKYTWFAGDRTLVCEKAGQEETYLTECDEWDFALYQRTAQPDLTNVFFPAANPSGALDPAVCKIVDMNWKCSHTLLGKKWNTESVQTARMVLRNKP
jgi:hypothetical protein